MKQNHSIIESAMRHYGITVLLTTMLVALGVWGLVVMPKQEFPTVTIRQGVVVGIYPGATSEQVESELAKPLERFLFNYAEVNRAKTQTLTRDGVVYAMVELQDEVTNKDEVWSKIKHGIELFKHQLPKGVLALIANDEFGDTSALLIALESDSHSYRELEENLERLEDRLRRISSVSNLRRSGVQQEQISVKIDRDRLAAYGIDYKQLSAQLFSQGLTTATGSIETPDMQLPIHLSPLYNHQEQIEQQIIYSDPSGRNIKLKDVATVVREYPKPKKYILNNNHKSVILSLEMRTGYNIVEYGEDVNKVIAEFEQTLPEGMMVERIVDQPEVVRNSVSSFLRDLVVAIIIVILVMMVLFPLRSALVAATTIPLTVFISIALMYMCGIPLNTVTLAALIVVLGMIVDNSIVVIDGYLDYLKRGYSRWHAAVSSAKNYGGAIFIATLSVCIIFFPVLFIFNGIWYDFFRDFPWAFTICLMVSFVLAMLIIPYAEYRLISSKPAAKEDEDKQRFDLTKWVQQGYDWTLERCFKAPALVLLVGFLTIVSAGVLFTQLNIRMFPYADRNQFAVEIYLPQSSTLEQTEMVADSLYRTLKRDARVEGVTAFLGTFSPRFQTSYAPNIVAGANYAQFVVNTESNQATIDVLDEYQPIFNDHFPNAYVRFKQLDFQQAQIPIEIRLIGEDLDELRTYADSVMTLLGKNPNLEWVHTNYEQTPPSVEMSINAVEAARLGISRATAELLVASSFTDMPVGSIWEDGHSVDVVVSQLDKPEGDQVEDIANKYISSPIPNITVPLRQIAAVTPKWEQGQIVRRNGMRTITICADLKRGARETATFRSVKESFESEIAPKLPSTVEFEYGGFKEYDKLVIPLIGQIIAAGVCLIFLFLLYNYKRIKIAFVALLSLLFCLPGTIWGLWLTDTSFGLTCILGVISLMGIIIRNAIMIFDHAENLRLKCGYTARLAAMDAGKRRMVPIFLTSATTAIGILPMIFGRSMLWSPMGIVIFTGTVVSMILVVTILPVVYWKLFDKVQTPKKQIS